MPSSKERELCKKASNTMPILPPEMVNQVSKLVAEYIISQREKYIPRAVPLSVPQRTAMATFFTHELLNTTRLIVLSGEKISNPEFYPTMQAAGFDNLPDQSTMAAITFSDCVVAHVSFTDALLFHELVHVEQYRQLGVPMFADLYVKGFINGGGYFEIPLEHNAYSLGERYERSSLGSFSVADDVAQWIAEGRF
jgi:hypothetical protein